MDGTSARIESSRRTCRERSARLQKQLDRPRHAAANCESQWRLVTRVVRMHVRLGGNQRAQHPFVPEVGTDVEGGVLAVEVERLEWRALREQHLRELGVAEASGVV